MIRLRQLLVVLSALGFASVLGPLPSARAGSWIFRPSYFTHDARAFAPRRFGPTPRSRAYRAGPYVTRPQGAYVRSGWRHVHHHLRAGHGYDNLNYYESFGQFGEQF